MVIQKTAILATNCASQYKIVKLLYLKTEPHGDFLCIYFSPFNSPSLGKAGSDFSISIEPRYYFLIEYTALSFNYQIFLWGFTYILQSISCLLCFPFPKVVLTASFSGIHKK